MTAIEGAPGIAPHPAAPRRATASKTPREDLTRFRGHDDRAGPGRTRAPPRNATAGPYFRKEI